MAGVKNAAEGAMPACRLLSLFKRKLNASALPAAKAKAFKPPEEKCLEESRKHIYIMEGSFALFVAAAIALIPCPHWALPPNGQLKDSTRDAGVSSIPIENETKS